LFLEDDLRKRRGNDQGRLTPRAIDLRYKSAMVHFSWPAVWKLAVQSGRNDEYRTWDSQLRLCEPSPRALPQEPDCVEVYDLPKAAFLLLYVAL